MHAVRGKFVQSQHSYRMQVTAARWMRYVMQVCATHRSIASKRIVSTCEEAATFRFFIIGRYTFHQYLNASEEQRLANFSYKIYISDFTDQKVLTREKTNVHRFFVHQIQNIIIIYTYVYMYMIINIW